MKLLNNPCADIRDSNGNECAVAEGEYFTFNKDKAKEKLFYPGKNRLYNK